MGPWLMWATRLSLEVPVRNQALLYQNAQEILENLLKTNRAKNILEIIKEYTGKEGVSFKNANVRVVSANFKN